ncbi:MAG: hypothetical protein HUU54_00475 [Ignavibacteriaceae bacterium]|nr:hypothetical protein [Ignavibacteriaceae bacterium]
MKYVLPLFILLFAYPVFAQTDDFDTDSVEVILIEAYVTQDDPDHLILSFFTSEPVKSRLLFGKGEEMTVNGSFVDNHKVKLNISGVKSDTTFLEFVVLVEREDGTGNSSEVFEVELPRREIVQLAQESGALTGCLIGGMVYMIPGVVHYYEAGESYFGIDKELPVISYFRGGYNYPVGYLALEYIHLPKAVTKNFVSITANGILEFKPVEYLSAGIGYTTDFRKSNSLTLDVSVGLFRVLNVFTFYVENRFGYYPSAKSGYSQQSIGLFSSFFSIQL